ncbi:hypothetical protein [Nocardia arthritidis]|uniref:Uncharacterized protein n=1 Tax=Nocardia arthritidis TaxID=228602 RepID=A0A6G9YG28_9NOCA|nr:hypothetical protein [Nocardia arthritidis]QIS12134.1 hypothetical protein F5544_21355 [Nocardia arthritidis]
MCEGGRLLADFEAGTSTVPVVPEAVASALTQTVDGLWAIWAYKVARPAGDRFVPATRGGPYPADAIAECGLRRDHRAPDPNCTCGFHALSSPDPYLYGSAYLPLEVALTGRILAFEWPRGGLLFRAERQTVVRVGHRPLLSAPFPSTPPDPPLEPGGRTARLRPVDPRDIDRARLRLPVEPPAVVRLSDDAGFCRTAPARSTALFDSPDPCDEAAEPTVRGLVSS